MPSDSPLHSEADPNPFRSPAFVFDPDEPKLQPEKKTVKRSKTPLADEGDPLARLGADTPIGQTGTAAGREPKPSRSRTRTRIRTRNQRRKRRRETESRWRGRSRS